MFLKKKNNYIKLRINKTQVGMHTIKIIDHFFKIII